jgi:hypothetical protein
MAYPRLPHFVIIGAAKAATTWIASQLRARDDVFLPGPEPHYFNRHFDRGEEWYASLFAAARADQVIGEKSADYLADANAPRRMAAAMPHVRLVAQLRNPVDRAYSHYCMLFRRGAVGGDIARYLDRARTPEPCFLEGGLYARHIARFLDYFPREQLKIILHEDVELRPDAVIEEVQAAIGLPVRPPVHEPQRRVNDSTAPVVPLALRRLPMGVKNIVAPLRGTSMFQLARNMIAHPVQYPPLPRDIRARVQDFYRDDIANLGNMIGVDLDRWTCADGAAR